MQSGAVMGYFGLVKELVAPDHAASSARTKPKVVLTGGFSALPWANAIPSVDVIDRF